MKLKCLIKKNSANSFLSVCVCVRVLVYATLFMLFLPMRGKNIKNSKLCLSESVTMQTGFLDMFRR